MGTPKETAEAIFLVIKRLLKWLLIIVVILGLALYLFAKYEDWREYQTNGKHEEKVTIDAYFPTSGNCHKDFPYQYNVWNGSERTVERVSFTVEIRKKGYSSALNTYTSLEEDKIIKPKEGWGRCFRAVKKDFSGDVNDKDVDIVVTYKNVTLKQ